MAISPAEAASIRTTLASLRGHTCTWTPVEEGDTPNPWGGYPRTPGTPVTGVPCLYTVAQEVVAGASGRVLVSRPSIRVAHDLAMQTGDTVEDIRDSEGNLLEAGPVTVGPYRPAASLGPLLQKRFELAGAQPSE